MSLAAVAQPRCTSVTCQIVYERHRCLITGLLPGKVCASCRPGDVAAAGSVPDSRHDSATSSVDEPMRSTLRRNSIRSLQRRRGPPLYRRPLHPSRRRRRVDVLRTNITSPAPAAVTAAVVVQVVLGVPVSTAYIHITRRVVIFQLQFRSAFRRSRATVTQGAGEIIVNASKFLLTSARRDETHTSSVPHRHRCTVDCTTASASLPRMTSRVTPPIFYSETEDAICAFTTSSVQPFQTFTQRRLMKRAEQRLSPLQPNSDIIFTRIILLPLCSSLKTARRNKMCRQRREVVFYRRAQTYNPVSVRASVRCPVTET